MSDLKCVRVLLAAVDRDIEILQQIRRMADMTRKTSDDSQDRDPEFGLGTQEVEV